MLQVRRKADNARDPVREFIGKWKKDLRVQNSPTYRELSGALSDLGQYYMERGQRAAVDKRTASRIMARLENAEAALPAEEPKEGFLSKIIGS